MRRLAGLPIGIVAAALIVAGCSSSEPERSAPEENVTEAPAPPPEETQAPEPEPAPPPKEAEPVSNIADLLPPDESTAPDQQMMDDADATGLTARLTPPDVVSDAPAHPVDDSSANQGLAGSNR